jgi:hypothetical protein
MSKSSPICPLGAFEAGLAISLKRRLVWIGRMKIGRLRKNVLMIKRWIV